MYVVLKYERIYLYDTNIVSPEYYMSVNIMASLIILSSHLVGSSC